MVGTSPVGTAGRKASLPPIAVAGPVATEEEALQVGRMVAVYLWALRAQQAGHQTGLDLDGLARASLEACVRGPAEVQDDPLGEPAETPALPPA